MNFRGHISDADSPEWPRTARRVGSLLAMLVLIALVLPFVMYAFPPAIGAEGSYVVLSGSMQPAIQPGDVMFVYEVDPLTIEAGDVVMFSRQGSEIPTTHRVIEVVPTNDFESGVAFRTMGDANEDPDQRLVPGESIVGVVPAITLPFVGTVLFGVPEMGHVVQFANTQFGFVLLVGIPITAFILNEVYRAARGSRSEPEKTRQDEGAEPIDGAAAEETEEQVAGESIDPGSTATVAEPVDEYVVSQTDLKLTLLVLGLASTYALWVTYKMLTPWSVSVAVAGWGSFLYLAALRHRALADMARETALGATDPEPSLPDGGSVTPEEGSEFLYSTPVGELSTDRHDQPHPDDQSPEREAKSPRRESK